MTIDKFNQNIPENFFFLITGKNRGFYARVLADTVNALDMSETFNIPKTTVLSIIAENIKICTPREEDDFQQETMSGQPTTVRGTLITKEYAYGQIKRCGWIVEEESDDLNAITVSLTSLARLQINSLMNFITTDEVYIGNFKNTLFEKFEALLKQKCARPYMDAFKVILECCEGISAAQTRIHDNIRKQAAELLRMTDRDEAVRIIHSGLDDLNTGEAQKLLIVDGIDPMNQSDIAAAISEIRIDDDIMPWIAADLQKSKPYLTIDDAMDEVESGLRKVELCLSINYGKKVNDLGMIKGSYFSSVMSKLRLLAEDSSTFANEITHFLMRISGMSDGEYEKLASENMMFRRLVAVRGIGTATNNARYTPKNRENRTAYEQAPITEVISTTREFKLDSYVRGLSYTNKLVGDMLRDRDSVSCCEFDVSSRERMNDLIAVVLNAYSSASTYTIEFTGAGEKAKDIYDVAGNKMHEVDGNAFPEFVIKKKEERKHAGVYRQRAFAHS